MKTQFMPSVLLGILLPLASSSAQENDYKIEKGKISGYGQIGVEKVSEEYGGGFSLHTAVWPLVEKYPGKQFQTGLFHTWMFANYDPEIDAKGMYTSIEGGLGWWRDTRFATETPKFIMGGVALKFSAWANGPGAGKGRSWTEPKGKYAVAQLSSRVLWPPDGLNLKQGTFGELFGYGYRPLPLIEPKDTTDGHPVPTGNQCWTLFINSATAKGPIAFFLPEFFARPTIEETEMAGQFLDSRPAKPDRHLSMETQYIPAAISKTAKETPTQRSPKSSSPEPIAKPPPPSSTTSQPTKTTSFTRHSTPGSAAESQLPQSSKRPTHTSPPSEATPAQAGKSSTNQHPSKPAARSSGTN